MTTTPNLGLNKPANGSANWDVPLNANEDILDGLFPSSKLALNKGGTGADLSGTGGTSRVLKQTSAGSAVTVSQLAASDLSNGVTGSGAVVLGDSPIVAGMISVAPDLSITSWVDIFTSPATSSQQGYTTDGVYHYTIDTGTIYKRNNDGTWSIVTQNSTPFSGLPPGVNHCGDGCYYNGKLYIPVEYWDGVCGDTAHQTLAVYDATSSGLPLLTYNDISGDGHEVSAICVVPLQSALYIASFCDGTKIWKYDLTTLTLLGTVSLSQTINRIQGITYNVPTQSFFIAADNSSGLGGAIYQVSLTGQVTQVYIVTIADELEGLDFTQGSLRYLITQKVHYLQPTGLPLYVQVPAWQAAQFGGPGNDSTYTRLGKDGNGLNFTSNLRYDPELGNWVYDDSAKVGMALIMHEGNGQMEFRVVPSGLAEPFATTTYKRLILGSAVPPSGDVLRSNGTTFVDAALAASDLSNGTTGTGAVVLAGTPVLTGTVDIANSILSANQITVGNASSQAILRMNDVAGADWSIQTGGYLLGFYDHNNVLQFAIGNTSAGQGVWVGAPTGSGKGTGTINVETAYYINGTPGVTQTAGVPTSIATIGGIVTTLTVTSDERLKSAVPYKGGLDEILSITPIRYKWNEKGQEVAGDTSDREYVGFSAQDVQKKIPESIVGKQVAKDGAEYLGFDDRPVIAALVNAVKAQQKQIEKLQKCIEKLQGQS